MPEEVSKFRFIFKEAVMPAALLGMTAIFAGFNASASKEQGRIKACQEIIKDLSNDPVDRPKTVALYALLKRYDADAAKPLEGWFAEVSLDHTVALMQDGRTKEAEAFVKALPPELLKADGSVTAEKAVSKAGSIANARTWERAGWDNLEAGKVEEAQVAFQKSEKAYPSFRQSFEISKYIDAHKAELADPATQKTAVDALVEKHSFSAPKSLKSRLGRP